MRRNSGLGFGVLDRMTEWPEFELCLVGRFGLKVRVFCVVAVALTRAGGWGFAFGRG